MSRISTIALAATLAVASPVIGVAQQAPPASTDTQTQTMGPGTMRPGHMMGGRMIGGMGGGMMIGDCPMMDHQNAATPADRLNQMKSALAITDAQQGAWNAYTEKVTKNWENMGAMRDRMQQSMQSAKTPVERIDARITMMETRLSTMKDMKPVLQTLYDSLSADQKAKADQSLTPMGCMM